MESLCNVQDVGVSGFEMLGMFDVGNTGCSRCGMLRIKEVWDMNFLDARIWVAECWKYGIFGMQDVGDVACCGCDMFKM